MNDLTLSLVCLGVAFVAAVWGYNKLQERKYRQAAEKVFRGEQADVLATADEYEPFAATANEPAMETAAETVYAPLADERREPVLESPQPYIEPEPQPEPEFIPEPYAAPVAMEAPPAMTGNAPPADWCDESIDLIARLHFNDGIAADELRQAQSAMQAHQRVHLRVFVDAGGGRWLPLAEAGSGAFAQAWFALQLVDRRGAVSVNDFEALRSSLQALASLRNGTLLFPDVAAMGEQARALDDFCAQLDLQLAINVLDAGNGAFAGTKIRGMAEAAGMQLNGNGEFRAQDENGDFMFALTNMGEPFAAQTMKSLHTHGLTFLLDVPHVKDGGFAFERMLSSARQFASTLDAALVNAQRAPISDAMVDSIRRKIHEIHEQMTLAGIPSGGVRALRLFS
ncbi:MAG: cell division protein ZipA C-terminal FtsZ-binding domain-containing protein [Rhodocyclaceae bacterium]|nr:cell division protein ZipA C-terminal FtsZ-binding domain-containing protein [Rhodocyclaceae bacterium]